MTGLAQLGLVADPVETGIIPFGEWLPDQPELNNPGAVEALNVIPLEGSYAPFAQHVAQTDSLPDAARGAIVVMSPEDVSQVFAGTINGIFTKFGGGPYINIFTGVSNALYSYKFVRVNEVMVAIHPEHQPVRSLIGIADPAVVLGGDPPTAACGAQVSDFLMLGNLLVDPDDGGDKFPSRVRWSGFNNIDMPWVTDPAAQSDFQDLPAEGGPVVAIAGREVGTIYQERMISRASYRGLPSVFDIVTVEDKRGAIARDSIIDVGAFQFFIAEDGFFLWNGTNSTPIGDTRVNRYFFNRLMYSRRAQIVGAADFANGCVHWAFPTSSAGTLDEIITFSYRDNKFSHSIQTLEYLLSSGISSITLDELTDPLESYTISFDSPIYQGGGTPRLAAFNAYHAYGLFNGLPMAATLDTGEYSAPDGRRVFVNNARPLVDLATPVASMRVVMRDQMIGQPLFFSAPVAQELDGQCPVIQDARYMRFRVELPVDAAWRHALGVEVIRRAGGVF